ncbi:MAG: OmpH family outer membrane protein [Porphyrobacter sp.]|jgi:Skp family chaperone for outer membrane proteins|nr:OmpH family outer membrane protein [Porphyrobacter sp.]
MKTITRILAPAMFAGATLLAAPVAAQVTGPIGSLDLSRTVLSSTALATAYNEVGTTYAAQFEQIRTKSEQRQTILRGFDKDSNNQVDDAELAAAQKTPQFKQLETIEQEVNALNNQVNASRIYAIEQILEQVSPALQQVVNEKKLKLVLEPSAIVFQPPEADITQAVVTVLNTRLPRVAIVPPQNWQPSRTGVQMFQEIQQMLATAQAIQRQQQAQQQQGQAPAQPQGGAEAPVGR